MSTTASLIEKRTALVVSGNTYTPARVAAHSITSATALVNSVPSANTRVAVPSALVRTSLTRQAASAVTATHVSPSALISKTPFSLRYCRPSHSARTVKDVPLDKVTTVLPASSVVTPVITVRPLIRLSTASVSKPFTFSVKAARSFSTLLTRFVRAVSSYIHDTDKVIAATTASATTDLRFAKIFLIVLKFLS